MGIHEGHRDRLREKIMKGGIESLQPHEVLEYLLYGCVPRKDTNPLAHELMNTFGTLAEVLDTDFDRLMTVNGMTKNAALFISSLPDVFRMYSKNTTKERPSLKGRGVAREYLRAQLYGKSAEYVYVASVDAKDNLIRLETMSRGNGNSARVSVREIVDFALRTKASGLLLAHNHPSGDIDPSETDVDTTVKLTYLLRSIGVELQDHFIFSENKYYSFEEHNLIPHKN